MTTQDPTGLSATSSFYVKNSEGVLVPRSFAQARADLGVRLDAIETNFAAAPNGAMLQKNGGDLVYSRSFAQLLKSTSLTGLPVVVPGSISIAEQVVHTITIPADLLTDVGQHLEFLQAVATSGSTGNCAYRLRLNALGGTQIGGSFSLNINQIMAINRRLYYLSPTTGLIASINPPPDFAAGTGTWNEIAIDWTQPLTFVVTAQPSSTNTTGNIRMSTVRAFL